MYMYGSCSFTIIDNLVRYVSEDEIFELKQKLKYLNRGKAENYDMFLVVFVNCNLKQYWN